MPPLSPATAAGGKRMEEKRKTHTSSAVKRRYNKKAYRQIATQVKPELAERIQRYKEQQGISMSELLSRAMDALEGQ